MFMQTFNLMGNETILLTQPYLIDKLGRTGATLINQIHFWMKNQNCGILHNNKKWIYNTAHEWGRQIRLSERQIRHYFKKFSDMGILTIKKLKKKSYDQTNYITLNYDTLKALFEGQNLALLHPAERTSSKRQKSLNDKGTKKTTNINKLLKSSDQKQPSPPDAQCGFEDDEAQKRLVQEMIDLWNRYFPKARVSLNNHLEMILSEILRRHFSNNLMVWQNYLERMHSSTFITSQNFTLTFTWAINHKTIKRIFEGDLGVKDIPIKLNTDDQKEKAIHHIETVHETDLCKSLRQNILRDIGALKYNAWFTKVSFFQTDKGIHFKAISPFVRDYIEHHFRKFWTA